MTSYEQLWQFFYIYYKTKQGPEDQKRGSHHNNIRNNKNKSNKHHDNQPQKPNAVRHYDWNSTHFFPDIHDISIPFKRKPRSCFYNDLTWLDLPKGLPREKPSPADVAPPGANRENRRANMVMQDTSGDAQWARQDARVRDAESRDAGRSMRRHFRDSSNDAFSSDEENQPPPERLQSSQVVAMAREAAKRRSRSMDDYLHIPHMDETESEADSVASSPKVWRKNPLMARKVKREVLPQPCRAPPADGQRGSLATPPTSPTPWNRVDSSEFRNGHDASSGSRRSSLTEGKPQSPRRLSDRGSPCSRLGSRGSSPGLRRQNSDRLKEQYERFEELQQMRRALDSSSDESLPTLRHASEERSHEYIQIRRLSNASQDSLQKLAEPSNIRRASLTRRTASPNQQPALQHKLDVKAGSKHTPDGFDVDEPRLSIEERKALFEKLQQPKLQAQPSVHLRHPQGSKRLSHNQERREFEKRQSRTAFDNQSPVKYGAFKQQVTVEAEFMQKDRLQSSSFENIYDGVDLTLDTPEISEIEYEPRRSKRMQQKTHKRSNSGDQDKAINHRREAKIYGDNRGNTKGENLNLYLSRGNEQTVFGVFGDSSLTRQGQLPSDHSNDQSRDQTMSPESNCSDKRRNYDAKTLIAEEKQKFAEYKAEYAKRQSSHSSDPSFSEEELRANRISPHGSQPTEGLMDVAYPMETQQLPLTTKQRWQPLSREHSPWQPSRDICLAEPQVERWQDYHGYRGLTDGGHDSAFHAPVQGDPLKGLESSTAFPTLPHSHQDNYVDRDAVYSRDDYRGRDQGRLGGHKHSSSEPASCVDYEQNRTQQPPPRPQGSQGFYDDHLVYNSHQQDRRYNQHQTYSNQRHPISYQCSESHHNSYNQQRVDSKAHGAHQRPASHFQNREQASYGMHPKPGPNGDQYKICAGPIGVNLEHNDGYWFHQRRDNQPTDFVNQLRNKPQSVPTSPTSDAQSYGIQHQLGDDNTVRSSSAEGYHQERWWSQGHGQGHGYGHAHQGQFQGERSSSWDRSQREPVREPMNHQYIAGHSPPKAHGWLEMNNATSTQPHGWGATSSGSPCHRTPSPHRPQHTALGSQFAPATNRPEAMSDWSNSSRYEPHSGSTSVNTSFTAPQAATRLQSKPYTKPPQLSNTDQVFSDGYPSLQSQQMAPYLDNWVAKDLASYPGEAKPHVEQYDFQSYKNPTKYATLDQQFMSQQNVMSGIPHKAERLHVKRNAEQFKHEYDIYADPSKVRQMKTVQKIQNAAKQSEEKHASEPYPNDWSLPKSADELRKQFTTSSKERSEIQQHSQEKYTKFFITASPEPTQLNRIDVHSPRVSQYPKSRNDSLSSQDNSTGSGPKIEKLIADIRHRYEQRKEPSPKPKRKTQLQFDMKTEHPQKRPAYCVKADEQPEKPTPVNLGAIKANLFSLVGEKQSASLSTEDKKKWIQTNLKVSEIRTDVFNAKDKILPPVDQSRLSSRHSNKDDKDQRLHAYASYRDNLKPKRSNIEDELTDLERTYEQLNLNDEDAWEQALRHEAATVQSEDDLRKVRRLSITNLRKLETMQQNEGKPSLDYTRTWLASEAASPRILDSTDLGMKNTTEEGHEVFKPTGKGSPESAEVSRYTSSPQVALLDPPPETFVYDKRTVSSHRLSSSYPLKVGDDMAHRRVRDLSSSANSKPGFTGVGSYLASPDLTPATSMDSINRRSQSHRARRSTTPDVVHDDMAIRNRHRLSSAGDRSPTSGVSPSPTSADYLKTRETAPARGRMRSRPDQYADKYHDDFAYRQLRKDVAPVKVELPKSFIDMKQQLQFHPRRTQSLDRVDRGTEGPTRTKIQPKRSASISDNCPAFERRASLSKGIAKMMNLFDAPETITSSAPDLTNESAFKDAYNDRGDIVPSKDEVKDSNWQPTSRKQGVKQLLKQQTPRIVKQRNEYKSRMKSQTTQQTQRSESQSYTESESDTYSSTYSSGASGGDRQNRSPPDGATHSDEPGTQRCPEVTTPSSETSPDNYQKPTKKPVVTNQPEIRRDRNANMKASGNTVEISLTRRHTPLSPDSQESTEHPILTNAIVNTVEIPVTRIHQFSGESQESAKTSESMRLFETKKSSESSSSTSRSFSFEGRHSSESRQVYTVSISPVTPPASDAPLSPLLVHSSGQPSPDQAISRSSISKESIHLHKVGSTSVNQEQKPITVNIVQTQSKLIQNKVAASDKDGVARNACQVPVKQRAERIELQAASNLTTTPGRPDDIKETMTVLEQWKAQAEQKKRELQECLERELQEEKERAEKQRFIYEREVMNQSQVTKVQRRIVERTQVVVEERKEVRTVTQAKKLERQQLILKGQNKILAHRRLLPKKVETLDDLVASQPAASDFELEFSDYDNIETSDPEAGNAAESDDTQKDGADANKNRQGRVRSKSVDSKCGTVVGDRAEMKGFKNEAVDVNRPEEFHTCQKTETMRTESITPDGVTSVSQQTTPEVTSSGNARDVDDEEVGDAKPRLGRRPSFKDIVNSFEAKAPNFMRKPVLRRCSSQDSVHQDDPSEGATESWRLRDISGSEPNLRDRDSQRLKYHRVGGYYADLGSTADPVSEF